MSTPSIDDEFFRRHATSPLIWELSGVTLRYGAEVTLRQVLADTAVRLKHRRRKSLRPSLHGVCLMLFGLAIENLAKAVIVSRRSPLDSVGQVRFRNHDLPSLIREAGLSVSGEELILLQRLQGFIEWAGKYPSPRRARGMSFTNSRGRREHHGASSIGSDVQMSRAIADRLESLLSGKRVSTGMRLPSGRASVRRKKK